MVFLDVALVGLVAGQLLGGRLSNLADTQLRGKTLAFAAIALQLAAFPSELLPWSTPTGLAKVLWLASYALLIWLLVLNRRLAGAALIGAGLACNLVAILANGGLMPVRRSALEASGGSYHLHNNSIELGRPHLALLIDRWAAPRWIPLANVFSVGDVLIALGTLLAVILAMRGPTSVESQDALTTPREQPNPG
jgi:hypothetical protein